MDGNSFEYHWTFQLFQTESPAMSNIRFESYTNFTEIALYKFTCSPGPTVPEIS